ncbi:MAG: hypothetical protein ABI247_00010 [Rhodanobacter sp.]
MTTLLAVGVVGMAQATAVEVVTNGDFATTSPDVTVPTQFGTSYGGQFITGWVGNNGYQIWYPNANDAVTKNAIGQYTGTGKEKLYGPIAAPPKGTMTFVGLDGDQTPGIQSSIGQQLTGLTIGATYTVSFDWATAQLQSRTGVTTESLEVFFGGLASQSTSVVSNPSEGSTAWQSTSFQFVSDSTSAFLNFISVGLPVGLPPMALLTNVSVTRNVPEPPALAMFGGGLLGLGLLIMVARRREMHRRDVDGNRAIL